MHTNYIYPLEITNDIEYLNMIIVEMEYFRNSLPWMADVFFYNQSFQPIHQLLLNQGFKHGGSVILRVPVKVITSLLLPGAAAPLRLTVI